MSLPNPQGVLSRPPAQTEAQFPLSRSLEMGGEQHPLLLVREGPQESQRVQPRAATTQAH